MRLGRRSCTALVGLACFLGACALPLAASAQDVVPPPPDSGVLSGTVTATGAGGPVRRAQVLATRMPTYPDAATSSSRPVPYTTETDAAGRYVFRDLPPGLYTVAIQVPTGYAASRVPKRAVIAAGRPASLDFAVEKSGVVTGRVLDAEGDPLANALVQVLRRTSTTEQRQLMPAGGAQTDDRGQYRLFGLAPGRYVVSVAPRPTGSSTDGAAGHRGPVPTFYPGTPHLSEAQFITVGAGAELDLGDLTIAQDVLGSVRVTLSRADGQPVGPAVSVMLRDDTGFGPATSTMRYHESGVRTIVGVAPGAYYVWAVDRSPVANSGLAGAARVTVDGDETDVALVLHAGATVNGRIVAVPGQRVPVESLTVRVIPLGSIMGIGAPSMARPDASGAFTLSGLYGRFRLSVSGGPGVVAAIRAGDRDMTTTPFDTTGPESLDVEITFTQDTGTIVGHVAGARGDTSQALMVIAFPDDETRWYPQSSFVRITRPIDTPIPATPSGAGAPQASSRGRAPGDYQLPSLLPGRYFVVALPTPDFQLPDREILKALRGEARTVTVKAGESVVVDLRPVTLR